MKKYTDNRYREISPWVDLAIYANKIPLIKGLIHILLWTVLIILFFAFVAYGSGADLDVVYSSIFWLAVSLVILTLLIISKRLIMNKAKDSIKTILYYIELEFKDTKIMPYYDDSHFHDSLGKLDRSGLFSVCYGNIRDKQDWREYFNEYFYK